MPVRLPVEVEENAVLCLRLQFICQGNDCERR